jgi:ligand-binding sensor domain-containing protein/signal transduction histidine kinase
VAVRTLLLWCVSGLCALSVLHGTRLPIRTYTTADGLARDHILCIAQDSHGFLWFCTAEGLSRFDGYRFTNYTTAQGLPDNEIEDFLETRAGVYWVATGGGLCRFDPAGAGASRFHCLGMTGAGGVPAPLVLYEDRSGAVWAGGGGGVFRLGPKDSAFHEVDMPRREDDMATAILMDRRGVLWVGLANGLYRRDPDGSAKRYTKADGLPADYIMALIEDRAGHMWVGTRGGLARVDTAREAGGAPGGLGGLRVYGVKDGLPAPRVESLLETSDGTVWVGTTLGIAEYIPGTRDGGREFRSYTLAQGLSARSVGALAEDRDGNLWIGTFGSGAMKVAHSGFVTYAEADGLPYAVSVMETRQGEFCAISRGESGITIGRFDGRRFESVQPAWPKSLTYFGWGRGQIAVQDEGGEWWIATGQGLCRFGAAARVQQLAGARPKAIYTTRDGLAGENIFRVFEDSRCDIWIGTIGLDHADGLARWGRKTGRIEAFSTADGLPKSPVPTAFAEDGSGNVWIGLFHGGLARYRPGGRFTTFTAAEGIPGQVRTLYMDAAGRLWIGTTQGLVRADDLTAERPRFSTFTTTHGLSSAYVGAIAEDRWGRIYAATGRGIDRFEPQPGGPGRIRHYTTSDGVVPGELELALRDRQGALWFSSPLGLSQLAPSLERTRAPPPVLITGLSAGGVARAISDLGESNVAGLKLGQTPIRVDFVGLDCSPGEALHYQYMLENADREWGPPTDQRTVVYASLAAGTYRFLVRAVASDGAASPRPATIAFTVPPPAWRSWWFLAACGLAGVLLLLALHRYRLAQAVAVADVRTRIATDLHDDIGASLSQIAILSEVAKRTALSPEAGARLPLTEIAGISRALVDAMSDIVWAINPDHDHLSNLVYRMRRFATDVLGGQGIALQFRSSVAEHDLKIGVDVRRQVYLIFKEGIHNIARHSGADRVEADLDRVGDHLTLRLSDNGRGFDPDAEYQGRGLANMRKRAAALRGKVEFTSAPGKGTLLRMTVPVERRTILAAVRGTAAKVSDKLRAWQTGVHRR